MHIATATSHFILAIMALTGTVVHIFTGNFHEGARHTLALSIGVLLGAPVGAYLSSRIHGPLIVRSLALALCLVGLRVSFGCLSGEVERESDLVKNETEFNSRETAAILATIETYSK